jgi:uncharacterized membrane protein YdjX (TVP38/TMEM64 family)
MYYIRKGIKRVLFKFGELLKEYRTHITITLFGVLFCAIASVYYNQYFYLIRDPRQLKELIMSYGKYGILVLIGIQIVQVIIFFIPGGFVQIAGGYIYGALLATVISIIGTVLGSAIIFKIANRLGKPFITKVVSKKDMRFFRKILQLGHDEGDDHKSKNRSLAIIFLLYLIPGIPKDVLGYICGITDISFRDFILYSTVARIPGVFISSYFGSKIFLGNKIVLILIAVVMSMLFILGVFKGEKIIKLIFKRNK